jgi:hypothetical protein
MALKTRKTPRWWWTAVYTVGMLIGATVWVTGIMIGLHFVEKYW